jgi:hypothetical protein
MVNYWGEQWDFNVSLPVLVFAVHFMVPLSREYSLILILASVELLSISVGEMASSFDILALHSASRTHFLNRILQGRWNEFRYISWISTIGKRKFGLVTPLRSAWKQWEQQNIYEPLLEMFILCRREKYTYAAVAANVSKGFAIVTDCMRHRNTTTKAVIISSLALGPLT